MTVTYVDEKGRTWHKFSGSYTHELDDMQFSFEIWAIDMADAKERLEMIKANGRIDYQILEEGSL